MYLHEHERYRNYKKEILIFFGDFSRNNILKFSCLFFLELVCIEYQIFFSSQFK